MPEAFTYVLVFLSILNLCYIRGRHLLKWQENIMVHNYILFSRFLIGKVFINVSIPTFKEKIQSTY